MKADLKKMGDVMIVSIEGVLNIEDSQSFCRVCLEKLISEKLIFNMKNANFVGSTGLQPFLDAVKKIDEINHHGLKLVAVKPEFRRILSNIETQRVDFFEEVSVAVRSFDEPRSSEKSLSDGSSTGQSPAIQNSAIQNPTVQSPTAQSATGQSPAVQSSIVQNPALQGLTITSLPEQNLATSPIDDSTPH